MRSLVIFNIMGQLIGGVIAVVARMTLHPMFDHQLADSEEVIAVVVIKRIVMHVQLHSAGYIIYSTMEQCATHLIYLAVCLDE